MTADTAANAANVPGSDTQSLGIDADVVQRILGGLRAGVRLAPLSEAHRISREQIRRIGEIHGVDVHPDDYIAPAHVAFIRQVSGAVCRGLDAGVVYTTLGLRKRFPDQTPVFISSAIHQAELLSLLGVADPPEKAEFSVDDMLTALRAAASHEPGVELTGPTYDQLLRDGVITGPSRVLIIQRVGSWSEACEQAGVPYRAARRTYRGFDPAQVWQWLDLYGTDMALSNQPITFASYSAWAKQRKGAPSGSLIKARMLAVTGMTWNGLRDDLILRTYRSMPHYWVR